MTDALRPILIAILVSALLMGLVTILRLLWPRFAWNYLPPILFFTALEATLTTRWLRHPERRQLNHFTYRLAELVMIGLLVRLFAWAVSGGIPGWQVWRGYFLSPLSFFDGTFSGYLLCAAIAWERGVTFSRLFLGLSISPAELDYYSLPQPEQARRFHDRPIDRQRPLLFASLVKSWLSGGFVLAVLAAITTVNLETLSGAEGIRTIGRLGLRPEMLAALLVYFLLGLWLISRGRLAMMRARWLADGVTARPELLRVWGRASFILLLVVALIAAFLPIGSTFALALVLQAILGALLFVAQLVVLLFSFLLFSFLSLFALGREVSQVEPLPQEPVALPTLPPRTPPSEASALLFGGFFWLLVTVVALAAVFFYLRDRGYTAEVRSLARWWRAVQSWLQRLWRGAAKQTGALGKVIRARLRPGTGAAGKRAPAWRFIRINALSPREQIRYFYLSTVRRAGEKGVERAQNETPSEYAQDLSRHWPDAEREIGALTSAFLEARYSPRRFDREEVNPVKRVWKRVRSALRRPAGAPSSLSRDRVEEDEENTDDHSVEKDLGHADIDHF